MTAKLKCEKIEENGIVIIRLKKKIVDTSVADEFKDLLFNYLKDRKYNYIINFENVELFDTGCLSVLISFLKKMNGNGMVVLCCVKDTVYSIFKLIGVDSLFKSFENENEAISYVKNGG